MRETVLIAFRARSGEMFKKRPLSPALLTFSLLYLLRSSHSIGESVLSPVCSLVFWISRAAAAPGGMNDIRFYQPPRKATSRARERPLANGPVAITRAPAFAPPPGINIAESRSLNGPDVTNQVDVGDPPPPKEDDDPFGAPVPGIRVETVVRGRCREPRASEAAISRTIDHSVEADRSLALEPKYADNKCGNEFEFPSIEELLSFSKKEPDRSPDCKTEAGGNKSTIALPVSRAINIKLTLRRPAARARERF